MQAVESQKLILYHTNLLGQWPEERARSLAAALPYAKRLALGRGDDAARASLAGIALALHTLTRLFGRRVNAGELVFAQGEKPRLRLPAPDFSISHSGPWVACAAITGARLGLDLEVGTGARLAAWVVREALLKATGEGVRAASEVRAVEVPQSVAPQASVLWRGERWYVRQLDFFPGASACVVTGCAVGDLLTRDIPLAELFAP
jgi:phosphopantetheinyl transferase